MLFALSHMSEEVIEKHENKECTKPNYVLPSMLKHGQGFNGGSPGLHNARLLQYCSREQANALPRPPHIEIREALHLHKIRAR